jgi:serine phosphatase RsbU (regulator of sigma subunit)
MPSILPFELPGAIVGLRMGAEENLKIVKMIEKLSRVVQAGGSVSRFISLFYTELDRHGNLVYVNAGHVPPLRREAAKGRTAEQIVERFFEELDAFTGGALQIDDETAVVVRRVR